MQFFYEVSSHYKIENTPYRFDLLYRVTRDYDNTAYQFHKRCDKKGVTVVEHSGHPYFITILMIIVDHYSIISHNTIAIIEKCGMFIVLFINFCNLF